MTDDNYFMGEAIREAHKSYKQGGIPIGAVLVKDSQIISKGHNKLIQKNSAILHAEMDAIESASRQGFKDFTKSTLYTTLSPCPMCTGAIILYKIPKVVIGENKTLMGAENLLTSNNVEVTVLDDERCLELFLDFKSKNPEIWQKELEKVGNTTEVK